MCVSQLQLSSIIFLLWLVPSTEYICVIARLSINVFWLANMPDPLFGICASYVVLEVAVRRQTFNLNLQQESVPHQDLLWYKAYCNSTLGWSHKKLCITKHGGCEIYLRDSSNGAFEVWSERLVQYLELHLHSTLEKTWEKARFPACHSECKLLTVMSVLSSCSMLSLLSWGMLLE